MTTKNRSRRARQRRNRRILMTVCLLALVMVVSVGGTIAWLTAQTAPVTNTFTVGNINIDLDESDDLDLKMVPGKTIAKDPKVTVVGGSEDCWLFVKVDESTNLDTFITYGIADGWTQLTKDVDGNDITDLIYYREVGAKADNQVFSVLKTNDAVDRVIVNDSVTKEQMDALTENNYPTLTFRAYACQKDNVGTAADAWAKINSSAT